MMAGEDMAQKKLRCSGGYAIARVTDEEQKKGNLGGPELFLAGIGKLDEDRFVKYYCNKCEKEYEGAPALDVENPNEDVGEGMTLIEKGEYKCKACNSQLTIYRKFSPSTSQSEQAQMQPPTTEPLTPDIAAAPAAAQSDGFVGLQSLVGMSAYDSEAMLIGKVEEIGLQREAGTAKITLKIGSRQVSWDGISKIGDIVLLKTVGAQTASGGRCHACGYQNEAGSAFCAECGTKL
jgi:sporulation protein YlmC with PRC-barrel domain